MVGLAIAGLLTSCVGDLNPTSLGGNTKTAADIYKTTADYESGLAKLYATFVLTGQQGPAGNPDLQGLDEGFSQYLRLYWNCQELSTDEAVIAWNDQTIKDFHWQTWTPNDNFISTMYARIIYTVSLSNEYIRVTNGHSDATIKQFNAEARFLRALSYWHAIDLFGNPTFITEANLPGAFFPEQTTRANLFAYIDSE